MDEFDPAQIVDAAVKAPVGQCNATQLCVELKSTGEHLLINSSQIVSIDLTLTLHSCAWHILGNQLTHLMRAYAT